MSYLSIEMTNPIEKLGIKCPKCGSQNIVKIIYGYPTAKTMKKAEKGKIKLGGCCISENDPTRHCKDCGKNFLKRSAQ